MYKDIFSLDSIKKHSNITKLLMSLSLQIGSNISYSNLVSLIGLDKNTVERYINLLEQSFIIFRLTPKYKNSGTELKKQPKVYFYDLGIRNSLINNFNKIDERNDVEHLWKNYLIIERIKKNHYSGWYGHIHFWQNRNKVEVDYIEETGGEVMVYEIKWRNKKANFIPFTKLYPEVKTELVNQENYLKFIT